MHRLATADDGLGAVIEGVVDLAAHDVDLPGQRHRAVAGVVGAAGAHPLDRGGELVEELPVDRLDDVDAFDAGAGLARIPERAERGHLHGLVEVGVLGDDHRVLAAALGDERGEGLGAHGHDLAGGGAGAGEGDLVDTGAGECRAGLAEAGDHLEHRLRGSERVPLLLEPPAHARGQFGRLEHDGVAGGEGVGDRAHRGVDRVVPRPDDADHAERLVLEGGVLVGAGEAGRHPAGAQHLLGVAGGPVEVLDREHHLEEGVAARLAGLGGDDGREGLGVGGDGLLELEQPVPAAAEALGGPPAGGRPGAVDGGGHVGGVGDRVLREDGTVARVEAGERGGRGSGRRRAGGAEVLGHGVTLPSLGRIKYI
ncbi:hypothetical protein AIIKEEIJ_01299 [Rhodococcus sp. YH1]|nr:hypothetical protein [Rhodococcus sp. YH1]